MIWRWPWGVWEFEVFSDSLCVYPEPAQCLRISPKSCTAGRWWVAVKTKQGVRLACFAPAVIGSLQLISNSTAKGRESSLTVPPQGRTRREAQYRQCGARREPHWRCALGYGAGDDKSVHTKHHPAVREAHTSSDRGNRIQRRWREDENKKERKQACKVFHPWSHSVSILNKRSNSTSFHVTHSPHVTLTVDSLPGRTQLH